MSKNLIISKLGKALPGAVLESQRFGRSEIISIWIETQTVLKVAQALSSDSEIQLNWLENFSVVEMEDAFIVTYFLRSFTTHHKAVLRMTVSPTKANQKISLISVRSVWPMVAPMEDEAEEMFGLYFGETRSDSRKLPEGWKGYPLRKNYEFPHEVSGILHSRKSVP